MVTHAGLVGAPVALEGELRRLQRARLALHRCARLCGQHFGAALLMNITTNFVAIVSVSYWITGTINEAKVTLASKSIKVLKLFSYICFIIVRLLIICWICNSTSEYAYRSKLLMDKVRLFLRSWETMSILCVSMDRLKFSAFGFFDINITFFLSFSGAAIAYFVIVLQVSK